MVPDFVRSIDNLHIGGDRSSLWGVFLPVRALAPAYLPGFLGREALATPLGGVRHHEVGEVKRFVGPARPLVARSPTAPWPMPTESETGDLL